MRMVSAALLDLSDLAARIVSRPVSNDFGKLSELAVEIRRASDKPAEDQRVTNAAMIVVIVLETLRGRQREADADQWRMVLGALLPMLRQDAMLAVRQEREARP